MDLTLYYYPGTRAQRVRWVLEELQLEYQLHNIDLFKGEGNSAEFRHIHPLGQLPALKIDDKVMIESGAIVQWLAETHPEGKLAPALNSPDRPAFLQWMYFAVTTLEGPAWEIVLHGSILSKDTRVKQIIPFAMRRFKEVLAILENELQDRGYLAGNHFSVADIMTGYILMWFPEQLEHFPNLQGYVTRLTERPAYQRSKTN